MVDPYADGLLKNSIFNKKVAVTGRVVAVLDGKVDKRRLELIPPPSRALRRGEIHELILTGEEAGPGDRVDRIAYIAFFEVIAPGCILAGDPVRLKGEQIGILIGYDQTHMPNHQNIVLHSKVFKTGLEFGLELDDEIRLG